jgi:hypothetical protein
MFHPAGLTSHADWLAWRAGLLLTHERRVRVQVMHLDHSAVTRDYHGILDGQVTIDTSSDVITTANLSLLDPSMSIGWEPNSPRDYPHLRRMVQIQDIRYVAALGQWIWCPVFTGPVMDFDRDGATVSIQADSKARLAMGNFKSNHTWAAKTKVTDVITDMLVNWAGEDATRIHLPSIKATIPEKLTVHQDDVIWKQVVRLVHSVGMGCFYDGAGHFRMRSPSASPALTIDHRSLCSPVRVDRQAPDIKNRWIVRGPKPKAHKKQVVVQLDLPASHDWSAQNLGRNGVARHLTEIIQPGHVKNTAAATKIAKHHRDDVLRGSQQVSADVLPLPDIEPYDLVRLTDPLIGTYLARANQYTLPLGTGGPATFGAVKRVSLQPRGRGRKHKKAA